MANPSQVWNPRPDFGHQKVLCTDTTAEIRFGKANGSSDQHLVSNKETNWYLLGSYSLCCATLTNGRPRICFGRAGKTPQFEWSPLVHAVHIQPLYRSCVSRIVPDQTLPPPREYVGVDLQMQQSTHHRVETLMASSCTV